MKKLATSTILLLFTVTILAQKTSDQQEVQKVIETFFEGFHARDSVVMKSVFYEDPVIQTIGKSKAGEVELSDEKLEKVLKGIVSIPLKTDFKEELHAIEVRTDGEMAHAWTPYSFYVNDTFSHCGVNSFQLFKDEGKWKIIYLIDTRWKEGCDKKKLK